MTQDLNVQLLAAAKQGHLEQVQACLDAGADIESRDEDGWTPLMSASSRGNIESVRLLLWCGADLDAVNDEGQDAEVLAIQGGHPAIVDLLRAEMARRALLEDDAPSGCEESAT